MEILLFAIPLILVFILALHRNNKVYQFRLDLLNQAYLCSGIDVMHGRTWKWRYQMFESVEYNTMFFQFWRPLTSFYKDNSFLDPEAVEPDVERTIDS